MNERNKYINPLFWQHGEDEEVLRNEIRKMRESDIHDFIVEARPHPDYLKANWWRDLDIIIDEAKKSDMNVWLFDDGKYPSGCANFELAKKYPDALKKYLAENHIDVTGPRKHAHFLIDDWLLSGEGLFRIVAGKRVNRGDALQPDTLVDITESYKNGRLYWSVPCGDWRIFILKISPYGKEHETLNYVNPLDGNCVDKFIELTYEEHYKHYSRYFGNVISGFFTDEPRFGNTIGYGVTLGQTVDMPIPYTEGLLDLMNKSPIGDVTKFLPCLWYDAGDISKDLRYLYMDIVSRLFGENFIGRLGDWCRKHNVKLIGHLVEENGAHARLGFGAGHFFRAMQGMDTSGIDIVNNLFPEQVSGHYSTAFNYYDCVFNHWGLAKLASSAAHQDRKKRGVTMAEAFGAYGWFAGLKLMKWITDSITVRGINYIVPHAFSPADFPDQDCPPHFYARGYNPQWRNFNIWADYTNRVCKLITGGEHKAPVAVLYHAEAEWGGKYEPFELAVKCLGENQIDSEVVCVDRLLESDCAVENGCLKVADEHFEALIIPYCENISIQLAEKIKYFDSLGLKVIFMTDLPRRAYFNEPIELAGFTVCNYENLVETLLGLGIYDIKAKAYNPDLIYYHYLNGNKGIYYFVNQSTLHDIDTEIEFRETGRAVLYDAMRGKYYEACQNGSSVQIEIPRHSSLFVLFGDDSLSTEKLPSVHDYGNCKTIDGAWKISVSSFEEYPEYTDTPYHALQDYSAGDLLPDFSGTVRYEICFEMQSAADCVIDLGEVYEVANVFLNGHNIGNFICPPYLSFVPANALHEGVNSLVVEVTNTLVKKIHDNPYDRYFPQDPTGLLGDVKIYY